MAGGSDEPIVVGARDEATRILADVEARMQGLTAQVGRAAGASEAASRKVVVSFQAIGVAAAAITAIFALVTGAQQTYAQVAANVDAFHAQQASIDAISQSIRGQVADVEAATASHVAFAGELQKLTNIGDEQTLSAMRMAASMGVQEDQLQSAAATAAGLSARFGIDMASAMTKTVDAINGNAAGLQSLLPEMKYAYTEAQRFDMVLEAAQEGLGMAAERAETSAGKMQRAGNALGDLKETIGAIAAPIFGVVSDAFSYFTEALNEGLGPAVEFVRDAIAGAQPVLDAINQAFRAAGVIIGVALEAAIDVVRTFVDWLGFSGGDVESWGDTISSVVQWVAEQVIAAITWAEVILQNLPAVMTYVGLAAEAWAIGLAADFEHALTVQLPAYLEYFTGVSAESFAFVGERIVAFSRGAGEGALAPFRAVAAVLPGLMSQVDQALQDIARGAGVVFQASGMAVAEMPEVAARQLSERELELQAQMGDIGADLAAQFQSKFDERVSRLGIQARENLQADMKQSVGELDRLRPRIGVDTTQLQAVEARLLTRGTTTDPLIGIEASTRRTAEAVEKLPERMVAAMAVGLQPAGGTRIEVIE